MAESISYDRAADYYDETRVLPDNVASRLMNVLLSEFTAVKATTVLEVGVGTGRIARPLAAHGIEVVGVDVAPRMLQRLRDQLQPGQARSVLPILGDATALPFHSGSFAAVLAFHVFHLILPLEPALEELRRALVRGGVLIHEDTRYGGSGHWDASQGKWKELMAAKGYSTRSWPSIEDIHAKMRSIGGTCRTIVFAEGEESRTPAENLRRIVERIDSWTWEIADEAFADCLAEFEPWYRRYYARMDDPLSTPVSYAVVIWTFDNECHGRGR